MKSILIVLIALAMIPTLAYADILDGVVAYYPFTGDASDASGNGHHGTVVGATLTHDRFGVPNRAYSFDGLDDYINIGNQVKPQLPATFSMWVYFDDVSGPAGHDLLINDMEDGLWRYYGLFVRCNDGHLTARFNSGGVAAPSSRRSKRTDDVVFSPGKWHHVAVVFVDADDIRLFVDGIEREGTYGGAATTLGYSENDGYLGARENPDQSFEGFFAGKMDEVRVYDRVLTHHDIGVLADLSTDVATVTPNRLLILGNYPNPFNPSTTIEFEVRTAGRAQLSIYDVRGGLVRTLVDAALPAAIYTEVWDGRDHSARAVPSGVYYARLMSRDGTDSSKMLLVK